jgi:hypothetical protein
MDNTLIDAISKAVIDIENSEPIAKYMREQGFDPKNGCVLVFPEDMWYAHAPYSNFVPKYVRLSNIVKTPMLLKGFKI